MMIALNQKTDLSHVLACDEDLSDCGLWSSKSTRIEGDWVSSYCPLRMLQINNPRKTNATNKLMEMRAKITIMIPEVDFV